MPDAKADMEPATIPPNTPTAPAHNEMFYSELSLRLLRLEIAVRWRRPTHIPGQIIANVLRGAFNITFRRLVCPPDWMNHACSGCPLYAQCPYGQIFEPTPPPDADRLRLQADLPRPFVLKPPVPEADIGGRGSEARGQEAADRHLAADHGPRTTDDTLRFGLVLFGRAIDHLPHFVVTLSELGRTGLGPQRSPFDIESIAALRASSGSRSSPLSAQPLYDPATHKLQRPARLVTEADLLADGIPSSGTSEEEPPVYERRRCYLASLGLLPADAGAAEPREPHVLAVRFLTPTLIRAGSGIAADGRRIPAREVRERPDFGTLARRLRDRLSGLCAFFGERPWTGADFARLGRRADEVRLLHSDTQWLHRTRRSTRTGQLHELSGLTGEAVYLFPTAEHVRDFLPLLRFGELMGVGKHAVWGNGWLRVEGV